MEAKIQSVLSSGLRNPKQLGKSCSGWCFDTGDAIQKLMIKTILLVLWHLQVYSIW